MRVPASGRRQVTPEKEHQVDDDLRRIDDEPEDEDVEAHKRMNPGAAEEQSDDTDGDDDFELHKRVDSR